MADRDRTPARAQRLDSTAPKPRREIGFDWYQPVVPSPSTMTVDHQHKPVLYLPDGTVLVRRAGY